MKSRVLEKARDGDLLPQNCSAAPPAPSCVTHTTRFRGLNSGAVGNSVLPLRAELPVEMVQSWEVGRFHGSNSVGFLRPSGQCTALSQKVEQYIYINVYMHTYIYTANPTWGVVFESSKLKARTSLLPRFSEKRRSSFEL